MVSKYNIQSEIRKMTRGHNYGGYSVCRATTVRRQMHFDDHFRRSNVDERVEKHRIVLLLRCPVGSGGIRGGRGKIVVVKYRRIGVSA